MQVVEPYAMTPRLGRPTVGDEREEKRVFESLKALTEKMDPAARDGVSTNRYWGV